MSRTPGGASTRRYLHENCSDCTHVAIEDLTRCPYIVLPHQCDFYERCSKPSGHEGDHERALGYGDEEKPYLHWRLSNG